MRFNPNKLRLNLNKCRFHRKINRFVVYLAMALLEGPVKRSVSGPGRQVGLTGNERDKGRCDKVILHYHISHNGFA